MASLTASLFLLLLSFQAFTATPAWAADGSPPPDLSKGKKTDITSDTVKEQKTSEGKTV